MFSAFFHLLVVVDALLATRFIYRNAMMFCLSMQTLNWIAYFILFEFCWNRWWGSRIKRHGISVLCQTYNYCFHSIHQFNVMPDTFRITFEFQCITSIPSAWDLWKWIFRMHQNRFDNALDHLYPGGQIRKLEAALNNLSDPHLCTTLNSKRCHTNTKTIVVVISISLLVVVYYCIKSFVFVLSFTFFFWILCFFIKHSLTKDDKLCKYLVKCIFISKLKTIITWKYACLHIWCHNKNCAFICTLYGSISLLPCNFWNLPFLIVSSTKKWNLMSKFWKQSKEKFNRNEIQCWFHKTNNSFCVYYI